MYLSSKFLMINVLIVGLDKLSRKIISSLKLAKYEVIGFDLDVDRINLFNKQGLISNSPTTSLNDLLKEADTIILNIELSKYEIIFKLLPFIKNDCLIINTNTYKENINQIRKRLRNRSNNFIPCNFLLFPDTVIMNYDIDTKMDFILKTSNFFKNIKIKTSVLSPDENDKIFSRLYQIPYLLEKTLFKNSDYSFVFKETEYTKYELFFEDIMLNKQNILLEISDFIDNLPNIKDTASILELFDNNNLKYVKLAKNQQADIDDEIVIKILFEKIFIKTFVYGDLESYVDLSYLNFDYPKYDMEQIKEYYLKNKQSVEISMMIFKEKIINLTSFLRFDDLPLNKFIKFLNNL